ncbi:hypothetical protein TTHERM_000393299 (macronuclear) [Tetrahymena thermophila SB210]|uniref:Uncharacterized protein n=1 Tax=Tetrahymena thermophila (strain SB210) TaxID=312017 RepID=W7XL12_TETTS|nr:hypothetical protein TTHERM_000393299 [Tetrahymena thermophila SB210]EWS75484.1 hypothetical protein TTHERM_000393299 [Tetrahymena thermophila SB210]|eukprot:XP_012651953.1 hypothetical protein TTHERM_000393299 [Tetrahymena thermophila SB210]
MNQQKQQFLFRSLNSCQNITSLTLNLYYYRDRLPIISSLANFTKLTTLKIYYMSGYQRINNKDCLKFKRLVTRKLIQF